MKRIVNSPLKTIGLLTMLMGLSITLITFGYLIFLGLLLLGIGLLLYCIDFVIKRYAKKKLAYWVLQYTLSIAYLGFSFISYMQWQEHNYILLPKKYTGQAGIIFGIKGYPELPKTRFWKKTIQIPENGFIITSTKIEDIPNIIRFDHAGNKFAAVQKIEWQPNNEIDCIICDSKIRSWTFQIGITKSTLIDDLMIDICNEIAENKKQSYYKSNHSLIQSDNQGKYLWLQDQGLTSLPKGIENLGIYKAILTGNKFKEIPAGILKIHTLKELILAANPIAKFPCNLTQLTGLKSISLAATEIKTINCDLSKFHSLTDFDIARNGLTVFPEQIKNIPNLTWLSLNDNQLKDISFIDKKLKKIETLYLYTNKINKISKETKFLGRLKEFLIYDNEIDSIPDNISDLISLEKLEIWNNPIKFVSPKIALLTKLKSLSLDDDYLSQADKDNLKKWLPNCDIHFQTRREKTK